MNYKKLGNTDLDVSTICLGTMTWGEQNTQDEGFEQMDYALDQGVNFWDTAEIYSIPPKEETFGKSACFDHVNDAKIKTTSGTPIFYCVYIIHLFTSPCILYINL